MRMIGSVRCNNLGYKYIILDKIYSHTTRGGNKIFKFKVKFLNTGYETIVDKNNLYLGTIKDIFEPNVFGIGYIGCRNTITKYYDVWRNMLQRVILGWEGNLAYKSYSETTISKEWLNFSNFQNWCIKRKYDPEIHSIDKDVSGMNEYSERSCIVVPKLLNKVLQRRKNHNTDFRYRTDNNTLYVSITTIFKTYSIYSMKNLKHAQLSSSLMKLYYIYKLCILFVELNALDNETSSYIMEKYKYISTITDDELNEFVTDVLTVNVDKRYINYIHDIDKDVEKFKLRYKSSETIES